MQNFSYSRIAVIAGYLALEEMNSAMSESRATYCTAYKLPGLKRREVIQALRYPLPHLARASDSLVCPLGCISWHLARAVTLLAAAA